MLLLAILHRWRPPSQLSRAEQVVHEAVHHVYGLAEDGNVSSMCHQCVSAHVHQHIVHVAFEDVFDGLGVWP